MTMKKIKLIGGYSLAVTCFILLAACTAPSPMMVGQVQNNWDFDHKLQFKTTKFADNRYQLEVMANDKQGFERLSAFLLRQSYSICGSYGYTLELIAGVESFDYSFTSPNLIRSNLTAKLECPRQDKIAKKQ